MDAAITTKAYLKDRDTGRDDNRKVETEIARLWQRAATAIDGYDHQLYTSASLKALGWADPAEWKRAEGREWAIKIDTIIEQCQWLRREHKG